MGSGYVHGSSQIGKDEDKKKEGGIIWGDPKKKGTSVGSQGLYGGSPSVDHNINDQQSRGLIWGDPRAQSANLRPVNGQSNSTGERPWDSGSSGHSPGGMVWGNPRDRSSN